MAIGARILASYTAEFDPSHRFVTSWVLPPVVLFVCRALLSIYAFATLFTIFGWNGTHGMPGQSRQSFSYFTHLTYWGLAFYFAFSAVHTFTYWLTGRPLVARWPKALQVAHSMFYSTIVVYPFIVTIVYWVLLAPTGFKSTFALWSNTSQHALNSAYALFEIVFPRTTPLPWIDVVPIVIILALYLALAYVTKATAGFYTYDFLDLSKHSSGIVAAYIIGILVGAIIIFILIKYIIFLRMWVTEKRLKMTGKFSSYGIRPIAHEELEKGSELNNMGPR